MLKGKVAVITGGSRGIGFTVAQKMAENHADIALIDVGNIENTQASCDMLKVFGVNARPYKCDVSDFAAVKATVAQIVKDFGTIDILVNNAGITRDSLIFSMSEENWDAVININLKSVFNMTKHCSPI
ncbi:MAG: SDR family NAD(P)-dependent oxidoreductase, partial [Spirochaetia bacterium]|nr:SDR family NAD(P)-dependent oxidoreductase [Spirochaetia bacterium]